MNTINDTPRTTEAVGTAESWVKARLGFVEVVHADFSRTLELGMERYRLITLKQDAEIAGLRAELEDERAECLEQARLNGMGAQREAALLGKIEILRRALEEIASYDNGSVHGPGICPYGCDTPHIAQLALCNTGYHAQPKP